jgi:hypothetical protein
MKKVIMREHMFETAFFQTVYDSVVDPKLTFLIDEAWSYLIAI